MAFDQVSLFLYPPRWRRHSVPDTRMKHYSGKPVEVVSAIRADVSDGQVVQFDALCRWFEAKDFKIVVSSADHAIFHSATIDSALGPRPEIDVSFSAECGELTEVYCRFLLNHEAPLRLNRWVVFMQEMCPKFSLRISVSDAKSVGPEEFLTIVQATDNWRSCADRFGWSESSE